MVHLAVQPGLVVVDATLNLLALNSEAIQILTYPERPEKIISLDEWISWQIRTKLLESRYPSPANVLREFKSSRRTYFCRSFPLNIGGSTVRSRKTSIAILLERKTNRVIKLAEVSHYYNITSRELETVQLLLQGLTNKEIAQRMGISPNTVRALVHLVMVKMKVSTRSGIIGKIVGPMG